MRNFDEFYERCLRFREKYHNLLIPYKYRDDDGYYLGSCVHNVRSGVTKLTPEQREKLEEIGFVWRVGKERFRRSFDYYLERMKQYKQEHGDLLIPQLYCTSDGVRLGCYVAAVRVYADQLTSREREALDAIGFVWRVKNKRVCFDDFLSMYDTYMKEHPGKKSIPVSYTTEDGIKLGNIERNIRYGKRMVNAEQRGELDKRNFLWKKRVS